MPNKKGMDIKNMETYEKKGYLDSEFRIFHLVGAAPEELDYHYHDFDKITIFIKGMVRYQVEGRSYDLQPYDIVLVNHHEIHKPLVDNAVPYERIIVYISPAFMEAFKTEEYDLGYCFELARTEHTSVLRFLPAKKSPLLLATDALEKSFTETGYANELYRQVLFIEFMIHLNRAALKQGLTYIDTSLYNQKIVEIMEYITAHLTEDLNISQLSQTFFISRHYMMRLFKAETGYTIGNYIIQKRLALAKELMLRDIPATQVCFDCGFRNYSAFYRSYKQFFKEAPHEAMKNM